MHGVRRDGSRFLYGWNTLGAACGSLVAAAILFRTVDFVTSVRIGAMLSFGCALGAVLGAPYLVRRWSVAAEAATGRDVPLPRADDGGHQRQFGLSTWIAVYALSGFVALSLEIVWFRILGVILKSNSFTFGHLLAVYLGGVGLGALVGKQSPGAVVAAGSGLFPPSSRDPEPWP